MNENENYKKDNKIIKKKIIITVILFFFSSIPVTFISFIPEKNEFKVVGLLAVMLIPIFVIIAILKIASITQLRRKYQRIKIYEEKKSLEQRFFFPFFSNPYATVSDIVMIASLTFTTQLSKFDFTTNYQLRIGSVWALICIFCIEMHFLFNGKNFNFYYNVFLKKNKYR